MQRDGHTVDIDRSPILDLLNGEVPPEAFAHERCCVWVGEVVLTAASRVVAVGMRDDGARHASVRIDVEITSSAVESVRRHLEHDRKLR